MSNPLAVPVLKIDRARTRAPPGGEWEALDPVARGRVQILPSPPGPIAQAQAAMTELRRLARLDPDWDWSTCAVIAREWKYLAPVRAWCEAHGVPAQMGNEEFSGFWRLRETRALLDRLRGRKTVNAAELREWLDGSGPRPPAPVSGPRTPPSNPWIELLGEAVEEHALESGGTDTPVDHFIEWLAEWGRDARRRQRGLLLLTAHRAKGLEFDHVVVLDGGWESIGKGEDPDAPRRLYYVAMTRARRTLVLMRFEPASLRLGRHPHRPPAPPYRVRPRRSGLSGAASPDRVAEPPPPAYAAGPRPPGGAGTSHRIAEPPPPAYRTGAHPVEDVRPDDAAFLRRAPTEPPPASPGLDLHYSRLGLGDVDLGFAGRHGDRHRVHRAIAALAPGDPLEAREAHSDPRRWELLNRNGDVVGRLSNGFEPPPGTRYRSATVLAIVGWSREASEPQYHRSIKCDTWEVVVPELVFGPAG